MAASGVSDERPGPRPGRLRADARSWFGAGRARRTASHRIGRCAECFAPLASRRATYCSPTCRWRFHGRFFWDAARQVVLRRDRYTCQRCLARKRRRELEVDHIVEIARGGAMLDYANLQTLCRPCHREKTVAFLRGRPRESRAVPRPGRSAAPEPEEAEWFPA